MIDTDAWAFFKKWADDQGISQIDWLNFRKRGIPHKYRLPIDMAARAKRVKIDPAAFDQTPARENGK